MIIVGIIRVVREASKKRFKHHTRDTRQKHISKKILFSAISYKVYEQVCFMNVNISTKFD